MTILLGIILSTYILCQHYERKKNYFNIDLGFIYLKGVVQPKCNFSTPYIFVLAFGLRTWRKDFMLKRGQKIGLTEGKALSLLSLFFLGDLAVAPARRCVKT